MKGHQATGAEDILREYAAVTGWDTTSMLAVALDYINRLESIAPPESIEPLESTAAQVGGGAFRAFVRERAAEEVAMTDA